MYCRNVRPADNGDMLMCAHGGVCAFMRRCASDQCCKHTANWNYCPNNPDKILYQRKAEHMQNYCENLRPNTKGGMKMCALSKGGICGLVRWNQNTRVYIHIKNPKECSRMSAKVNNAVGHPNIVRNVITETPSMLASVMPPADIAEKKNPYETDDPKPAKAKKDKDGADNG